MKEKIKILIKDFHKGEIPTLIRRDIKIPSKTNKIICLIGSRRSGKTYTLFQIMEKLLEKKIEKKYFIYINFEDERFDFNLKNLDLIVQSYGELYPNIDFKKCYFFFDEIQNIENWEKFVRRVYDNFSKNIFITGSSSKLLSTEISTTLRGRSLSFEIYPLSFSEFLKFKKVEVDIYDTKSIFKIKSCFNNFLKGSFIEKINLDNNLILKLYEEYLNVMIYKDLIERYNISNVKVVSFFIKKCCLNISREFSLNKSYNEVKSLGFKVSKDFLYSLPKKLEDIFLLFFVNKYDNSVIKQELSFKKIYLIDNGFNNLFKFSQDFGRQLENIVFLHYKRKSIYEIFYHKNKFECDFLLKEKDKIVKAIQVTKSLNYDNEKREIMGLVEACSTHKLKRGLILTYEDEKREFIKDKIKIEVRQIWKYLLN